MSLLLQNQKKSIHRQTRELRRFRIQSKQADLMQGAAGMDADRSVLLSTRATGDSAVSNAHEVSRVPEAVCVASGTSGDPARGSHT